MTDWEKVGRRDGVAMVVGILVAVLLGGDPFLAAVVVFLGVSIYRGVSYVRRVADAPEERGTA